MSGAKSLKTEASKLIDAPALKKLIRAAIDCNKTKSKKKAP